MNPGTDTRSVHRPIGVFDSGVGGLSILKELRAELPHEHFVYVADSGHAPYGERDDCFVIDRARAITAYLIEQHNIGLLVVACNTATAAAIHLLRDAHPQLPIIGVEPALKPAIAISRTGRIGVMATRTTLGSAKFKHLLTSLAGQADFVCQPCDGLADAIEHEDDTRTSALCATYTEAMGSFGTQDRQIDTLVLGCTHYPFAHAHLAQALGPQVQLLDNGQAIARQTRRMLKSHNPAMAPGQYQLLSTGDAALLQRSALRWLALCAPVGALMI